MMQLNLIFADSLSDDEGIWQQLDETTHEAAIDRLAQAIAKVVAHHSHPSLQETNDE
jgi:hypothetical protein